MDREGRIDNLERAFEVLMGLAQRSALPQPQANLPSTSIGEDWLDRVSRHRPPTYDGKEDPVVLESWVRDFDRTFEALNCPEERRTNIAAYFLRGPADTWWEDLRTQGGRPASWEDFKTAIRTRFYTESLKRAKLKEFIELTQGDLSVREYYARFTELLRFAPGIATSKATVVFQFEQGLRFNIRSMMGADIFHDLSTVYERACNADALLHEQASILGKRKKEETAAEAKSHRPSGKVLRDQSQLQTKAQRKKNQSTSKANSIERSNRHYHCRRCKRDHPGKDCRGKLIQCHDCGQLGHRSFECYSAPREGFPRPQQPSVRQDQALE